MTKDIVTCYKECYFYIDSISKCSINPDPEKPVPDCYSSTRIGKPCIEGLDQTSLLRNQQKSSAYDYREDVLREVNAFLREKQEKKDFSNRLAQS